MRVRNEKRASRWSRCADTPMSEPASHAPRSAYGTQPSLKCSSPSEPLAPASSMACGRRCLAGGRQARPAGAQEHEVSGGRRPGPEPLHGADRRGGVEPAPDAAGPEQDVVVRADAEAGALERRLGVRPAAPPGCRTARRRSASAGSGRAGKVGVDQPVHAPARRATGRAGARWRRRCSPPPRTWRACAAGSAPGCGARARGSRRRRPRAPPAGSGCRGRPPAGPAAGGCARASWPAAPGPRRRRARARPRSSGRKSRKPASSSSMPGSLAGAAAPAPPASRGTWRKRARQLQRPDGGPGHGPADRLGGDHQHVRAHGRSPPASPVQAADQVQHAQEHRSAGGRQQQIDSPAGPAAARPSPRRPARPAAGSRSGA